VPDLLSIADSNTDGQDKVVDMPQKRYEKIRDESEERTRRKNKSKKPPQQQKYRSKSYDRALDGSVQTNGSEDLLQSVHKVRNKEPLSHSVPDLLSIADSNTDGQDKVVDMPQKRYEKIRDESEERTRRKNKSKKPPQQQKYRSKSYDRALDGSVQTNGSEDLLQSVHKVRNKEPLSHSVPDLLSISDSNTDEQDKGFLKAVVVNVLESVETVTLTITKCTAIGPPGVGKTALKHLLLGQELEPRTKGTGAVKPQEGLEQYVQDDATWKPFTSDEQLGAILQKEETFRHKEEEKEEQRPISSPHKSPTIRPNRVDDETVDLPSDQESIGSSDKHDLKHPQKKKHNSWLSQVFRNMIPDVVEKNDEREPKEEQELTIGTSGKVCEPERKSGDAHLVREDYNIRALRASLGSLKTGKVNKSPGSLENGLLGEKPFLYFTDVASQENYHELSPILITSPSAYFVVFDLMEYLKSAEDKDLAEVFRRGPMQHVLHNIHAFATTEDCDLPCIKMSSSHPKIFVIGTHVGAVTKSKVEKKITTDNDNIRSELLTKPFVRFIQPSPRGAVVWPFVVSSAGMVSPKEPDQVGELMSKAVTGDCNVQATVPLSWLKLAQTIKTMPYKNANFYPYHQLYELCKELLIVSSEPEYRAMLHTFHMLGVFFHPFALKKSSFAQNDLLYTNPSHFYQMTSKLLEECKKSFPCPGIIQEPSILLSNIGMEEKEMKSFIGHLKELRMIVLVKISAEQNLILFPAALPDQDPPDEDAATALTPTATQPPPAPLLLSFTSPHMVKACHIPYGLFHVLIAELCKIWSIGTLKQNGSLQLSQKYVAFDVPKGTLALVKKTPFIEIRYKPGPDDASMYISCNELYQELEAATRRVFLDVYGHTQKDCDRHIHWGFPCESCHQRSHLHMAKFLRDRDEYTAKCLYPGGRSIQLPREDQVAWFSQQYKLI
jgi:GTPase SAR1 family protein